MIPFEKLKTKPETTSKVPHRSSPARIGSVRGLRQRQIRPPTSTTRAVRISHEAWTPNEELNRRVIPEPPPNMPPAPPPKPGPALPASSLTALGIAPPAP